MSQHGLTTDEKSDKLKKLDSFFCDWQQSTGKYIFWILFRVFTDRLYAEDLIDTLPRQIKSGLRKKVLNLWRFLRKDKVLCIVPRNLCCSGLMDEAPNRVSECSVQSKDFHHCCYFMLVIVSILRLQLSLWLMSDPPICRVSDSWAGGGWCDIVSRDKLREKCYTNTRLSVGHI